MSRLVGDDFHRIFDGFSHTALRLESLAHYAVPAEREAYRDFLAGRPFDLSWHQPWLEMIKAAVDAGKDVRRVRVMSEPPTPYQAFELTITPHNLHAGEDIRILSTDAARRLALPDTDYWLFDRAKVVIMHFDSAGVFLHADVSEGAGAVAECRRLWNLAWDQATPYVDHIAIHPLPPRAEGRSV
jgi:hypothetical protein